VDRVAAASALSAPADVLTWPSAHGWRDAFTYALSIASAEDDAEIRSLLRGSAFAGGIQISLEREPDSQLAGSIEGDVHATIVARHQRSGVLAGIASRSIRDAFINGRPARLGYLGQLRVDPRYRRRPGLLRAGFDFCHQLHVRENDARVYLASVVADNQPARRLLARRSSGWPGFEPVDTLVTLAVPVTARHRTAAPADVSVHRGSADLVDGIVTCLERNQPRFQFSPRWTAADLFSNRTRGLDVEDFIVATRQGSVAGCAACWDQRSFKQVVVRAYARRLAWWRPLLNHLSPLTGTPVLPAEGSRFEFVYISHIAVDGDDVDLLSLLIAKACDRARAKGVDHVVLALSGRHAAIREIERAFRARPYESLLYVAFWPDGESIARSLDGRPSHPEVAIL
jgi:hypothetical protein